MKPDKLFMADQDQWFGPLRRRPHVLVLNSTNVINDTTVLSLRYGFTTWQDSCDAAAVLAGPPVARVQPDLRQRARPRRKGDVPVAAVRQHRGRRRLGPGPGSLEGPLRDQRRADQADGQPQLQVRRRRAPARRGAGRLKRHSAAASRSTICSPAGTASAATKSRACCSACPRAGSAPHDPAEFEWFTKLLGRLFPGRLARELAVSRSTTACASSTRTACAEINNRQTVAFDQNVVNPIDALVPKAGTLLAGKTLKGGLIYAGVNGAPEQQGNPKTIKPGAARRRDLRDRPQDGASRRVRAVLGAVELQHDRTARSGSRGRRSSASRRAESEVPLGTLDNPFPAGLLAPIGSSLGLLDRTSAVRSTSSIRTRATRRSISIQSTSSASCPARWRSRIGYIGATGRDIGYCGTNEGTPATSTSTRSIRPSPDSCSRSARGWDPAKLRESVPNPFFGIAAAGEFGTRATIRAGQLLRPFPEFGDILMHESTAGSKRQYHAVSFKLDKRLSGRQNWWGGRSATRGATRRTISSARAIPTRGRTRRPQNNYDLARRVRHQHLRLAAPDHPGADRANPRRRRTTAAWPTRCSAAGTLRRSSSW